MHANWHKRSYKHNVSTAKISRNCPVVKKLSTKNRIKGAELKVSLPTELICTVIALQHGHREFGSGFVVRRHWLPLNSSVRINSNKKTKPLPDMSLSWHQDDVRWNGMCVKNMENCREKKHVEYTSKMKCDATKLQCGRYFPDIFLSISSNSSSSWWGWWWVAFSGYRPGWFHPGPLVTWQVIYVRDRIWHENVSSLLKSQCSHTCLSVFNRLVRWH